MDKEEWETVDIPTHLIKDGRWVAIVAEIRDNATGEIRTYPNHAILGNGETQPSSFIWEDGNYSCDCNRRLFFEWSSGGDDNISSECGDGAYSVRLRNKRTGRVFYSEFENVDAP